MVSETVVCATALSFSLQGKEGFTKIGVFA